MRKSEPKTEHRFDFKKRYVLKSICTTSTNAFMVFGSMLANALQTVERFKIRSPGSIEGSPRIAGNYFVEVDMNRRSGVEDQKITTCLKKDEIARSLSVRTVVCLSIRKQKENAT